MNKYAAFLRGINVGGNKTLKMGELKKAFESSGLKNVKTILASGNILFESGESNTKNLSEKIEKNLKKKFGLDISVLIRSINELQSLSDAEPFKKIKITPQTRLYITFLTEEPKTKMKIPYQSADKNFKILSASEKEVVSVLTVTPESNTIDLMDIIQKQFGKKITTRNWNTILKILKAS